MEYICPLVQVLGRGQARAEGTKTELGLKTPTLGVKPAGRCAGANTLCFVQVPLRDLCPHEKGFIVQALENATSEGVPGPRTCADALGDP